MPAFGEQMDAWADQQAAMQEVLARANSATLCVVTKVAGGGVGPVGRVAVHPTVNQLDATGTAVPHGEIQDVPYFRLQGGANAVIIDPQVGDKGLLVFCDRDISAVKAAGGEQANPGTRRRNDMQDAIYFGVWQGGAPTQYVHFTPGGIVLHSPTKVRIEAPVAELTGEMRVTGDIYARYGTGGQVGVATHTHTQGNDGHGDAEVPVNPPTGGT
jgi:hypothetical protein